MSARIVMTDEQLREFDRDGDRRGTQRRGRTGSPCDRAARARRWPITGPPQKDNGPDERVTRRGQDATGDGQPLPTCCRHSTRRLRCATVVTAPVVSP
jgi:hypothetical protein